MPYLYLSIAIVLEVIATYFLKVSIGFTRLFPSIIVAIGYAGALFFLSLCLKTIPVGIAYAIWAGVGISMISIISAITFKQIPDLPAIIGILLIIFGIIIIKVFSKIS